MLEDRAVATTAARCIWRVKAMKLSDGVSVVRGGEESRMTPHWGHPAVQQVCAGQK